MSLLLGCFCLALFVDRAHGRVIRAQRIHTRFVPFAARLSRMLRAGAPYTAAAKRSSTPSANVVTFKAQRTVTSEPFEATAEGLRAFFGRPEAMSSLCSMADEYTELSLEKVEIITRIPFPGMTAKSVTELDVRRNSSAPSLGISSAKSTTLCETGPEWVRQLLVRILDSTKSTSNNTVSVEFSDPRGTEAQLKSDVVLQVTISYPGFIPLPIGPMEDQGSKALQDVLDTQMAPVLAKFREEYLKFETQRAAR